MKLLSFFLVLLALSGCIDSSYQTPYIISHTPEEEVCKEEEQQEIR